MWGYGLDRDGLGKGQVAGTCECGNEMRAISSLSKNRLASQEGLAPWSNKLIK